MAGKITESQWSSWLEDPVTRMFFEYLRYQHFDINHYRMNLLGQTPSAVDPNELSHANGMAALCAKLTNINLETVMHELEQFKQSVESNRKMMKEMLGVEV